MKAEQTASRMVVLSDLHLAPSGEHCVFNAHEALVALIEHLTDAPHAKGPQWLVLNGDVFDFLQIPGYDTLSLPLAPLRMSALLDDLEAEPEHRNVVRALARFTRAGNVLCCLPGNHDPELNLVSVQQVLGVRVGSSTALPPSAGRWHLTVAGRAVVGLHGHHDDPFNAISGERMRSSQAAGDATVPMPPGSRLVCQVINPFRRAKTPDGTRRFPFIDRLPSDQAVMLAIMLLDPRLAGRRLPAALGIGAGALVRKALMESGIARPALSGEPVEATAAANHVAWIDELGTHLSGAAADVRAEMPTIDTALDYELDAYFAGHGADAARQPETLVRGENAVRAVLSRALARALAAARAGFVSTSADRLADHMIGASEPGTVTMTGHTHSAKALDAADGRTYVNTGTWLDQVLPPRSMNAADLPAWLDELQRDKLPIWNGRPVAVVDADGARLMRWSGRELIAWSDASD